MTFYKDYELDIYDRFDMKTSVYVAALDVQYSHDLPYLWTFCFDMTGEVIYGRDFDDLNEFFDFLGKSGYNYDHKLIIYVDDLTRFFTYSKKFIQIDSEIVAKNPHEILIFSSNGLELRDFRAYSERPIDDIIYLQNSDAVNYHAVPDASRLSALAELTETEFSYSARRVLEIAAFIRKDLDMIYQGIVNNIKITKTQRISSIISLNLRRCDPDKRLFWFIHSMNPLSSEFGLKVVLPMLRKAFFGGTVFYEKNTLGTLFENVTSADLTSAYCGEFLCSKFPMSKFKPFPVPDDYMQLLTGRMYKSSALLIQFEARNVKLKKGAIPLLPAAMKHYYIDRNNDAERRDAILRAQGLKLYSGSVIRMCLTEIDFELFVRYYDFDSCKILSVLGARKGFLPDYIVKTVAELYHNKLKGKEKIKKLKKIGLLDPLQESVYDDLKTILARLYGIFTESPVVSQYAFDQEKKDMKLVSSAHIVRNREFRPVVYQWGVWTTALVRRKLCDLRDTIRKTNRTLAGDTDCVRFVGDAPEIIYEFNKRIRAAVVRRCEALDIDPDELKDIGELEIEKYDMYRMTAVKQYAYIRNSDSGKIFEFKCGGMNKSCDYFDRYSTDPIEKINHFKIKLTIPADYSPRRIVHQCGIPKDVCYTDRAGNVIRQHIESYQIEESHPYTLCDPFSSNVDCSAYISKSNEDFHAVLDETRRQIQRIKTSTPL